MALVPEVLPFRLQRRDTWRLRPRYPRVGWDRESDAYTVTLTLALPTAEGDGTGERVEVVGPGGEAHRVTIGREN